MQWHPDMRVSEARARLRDVIAQAWEKGNVTPTREYLLQEGVPAQIIDLFFRSVMLEAVRERVDQVLGLFRVAASASITHRQAL